MRNGLRQAQAPHRRMAFDKIRHRIEEWNLRQAKNN